RRMIQQARIKPLMWVNNQIHRNL
ncbi:hypothetical protein SpKU43_17530, partial [Streptococcus canis]